MPDQPNSTAPILIVDPDDVTRRIVVGVLSRTGYSTLEAGTGEEALDIARRERPCAVVLEVSLPGICGYEVCRELRAAIDDRIAIVFVSASRTEPFDRVGGLLLGADDYLAKPFDEYELLARVRRLITCPRPAISDHAFHLTRREQQVLDLLSEGLDQKEIASRLFISPKTVGSHTEHIYTKLGVRNRGQALARIYRDNLANNGFLGSFAFFPVALGGGNFAIDWLAALASAPLAA